jgi:hypothetical protein
MIPSHLGEVYNIAVQLGIEVLRTVGRHIRRGGGEAYLPLDILLEASRFYSANQATI